MGNWRLKFCEEVIRLGRRSSYFNGDALASKDSTIEDAKKDLRCVEQGTFFFLCLDDEEYWRGVGEQG